MYKTLYKGWAALDDLADGEYGLSLQTLLQEPDEELRFRQIGRLTAVWIKSPFSQSIPPDPAESLNWAGSLQGWEIRRRPRKQVVTKHPAEFALLMQVAAEWKRPPECLDEANLFRSLCQHLKPVVCGESKTLQQAEEIAGKLQKQDTHIGLITPNHSVGRTVVAMATCLAQEVPFLTGHGPLVTGATLLLACCGQQKLCQLLTRFIDAYDKSKDPLATRDFPLCGSRNTPNQMPCANRVCKEGERCWLHAESA